MMIVFDAAKAPTRGAFDHYMDKLKAIKPISWAKLMAIPHETWANYACRENTTWNQTTSNISESTNNMIGKEVNKFTHAGHVAAMYFLVSDDAPHLI